MDLLTFHRSSFQEFSWILPYFDTRISLMYTLGGIRLQCTSYCIIEICQTIVFGGKKWMIHNFIKIIIIIKTNRIWNRLTQLAFHLILLIFHCVYQNRRNLTMCSFGVAPFLFNLQLIFPSRNGRFSTVLPLCLWATATTVFSTSCN